jgi:uncharacterized protein (DUF488 family)
LNENSVEILVDVRKRAWSHRPEFRKEALRRGLEESSIKYLHCALAGNPYYKSSSQDIIACDRLYRKYLSSAPVLISDLAKIVSAQTAAFFCFESKTALCHRGILLSELHKRYPKITWVDL